MAEYERAPTRTILKRLGVLALLVAVCVLFWWPILAAIFKR